MVDEISKKIEIEVLKKIESGQVKMRPKSFFYIKVIISVLSIFFGLIVSALLLSYIFYSTRISGNLNLLGFGSKGIYEFMMLFPWLIVVLDVLVLLFVDWLLRSFKFGYKSSVIYLFLGTLVVMTLLSTLVNFTKFNKAMMYRAEYDRLLLGNNLYGSIRRSHSSRGLFFGYVESINNKSIILVHTDYKGSKTLDRIEVILSPELIHLNSIKIGDNVFVAGVVSPTSQVKAYGISKIVKLD